MVIDSELIWTADLSTGSGQGVRGEEEQKDHGQAGCMPQQGEGDQVGYQC